MCIDAAVGMNFEYSAWKALVDESCYVRDASDKTASSQKRAVSYSSTSHVSTGLTLRCTSRMQASTQAQTDSHILSLCLWRSRQGLLQAQLSLVKAVSERLPLSCQKAMALLPSVAEPRILQACR